MLETHFVAGSDSPPPAQLHGRLIGVLISEKDQAVSELKSLEGAAKRIVDIQAHIDALDEELIACARRVKELGRHLLDWAQHANMPAEAKQLLAHYAPKVVEAAADTKVQEIVTAVEKAV